LNETLTNGHRFWHRHCVNLGLDLRGGAHLLAEVAVSDVYEQRMGALWA
jgi:Preprotein translocase subunit SecD